MNLNYYIPLFFDRVYAINNITDNISDANIKRMINEKNPKFFISYKNYNTSLKNMCTTKEERTINEILESIATVIIDNKSQTLYKIN